MQDCGTFFEVATGCRSYGFQARIARDGLPDVIKVPTGAGLGVRLDEDRLAKYSELYRAEGAAFAFRDDRALSATPLLPKL